MAKTGLILNVHADYELAPHMVVFSHGFGVERTNRGMFTDIIKALPEDYGSVLFDYYEVEGQDINIPSFADQQRTLLTVISWLSQQSVVSDISLVAHSFGCVVAALAQPPEIQKVSMLAPPLWAGDQTRKYFTNKQGASQRDGLWSIPRRDGSTSYMPDAIFDEIEDMDPKSLLLDYAAVQPFQLLIAPNDEVLGDVDYNDLALQPDVTAQTIDNADHNFTGSSRQSMIHSIIDWIS